MAMLILFSAVVFGSFVVALMPATRTITIAIRQRFEPPISLPAVVPVNEPEVNPMADTLIGIEFDDAMMIGLADQIREAA